MPVILNEEEAKNIIDKIKKAIKESKQKKDSVEVLIFGQKDFYTYGHVSTFIIDCK